MSHLEQTAPPAPTSDAAARLGQRLAGALYVLLVVAAALALWVRQYPGDLPLGLDRAAPWVFLAFAVCFCVYRVVLVRAGKYPAGKALFQIGTTALLFILLLPWSQPRVVQPVPTDELRSLLGHADPRVRTLAAEVVRHRPDAQRYAPLLVRRLEDTNPRVREEAHRSLVQLAGEDLGAPGTGEAVDAWRKRFHE